MFLLFPLAAVEFPAVLLNTSTGEVESEFRTYVQPQEHPTLSEFCTELTGITQVCVLEQNILISVTFDRCMTPDNILSISGRCKWRQEFLFRSASHSSTAGSSACALRREWHFPANKHVQPPSPPRNCALSSPGQVKLVCIGLYFYGQRSHKLLSEEIWLEKRQTRF